MIRIVVAALIALAAGAAAAEDVKVGLIGTFSGPFASWGPQFQRGAELYMAEHGDTVGDAPIPLQTSDFASYLQRIKDAKPPAVFVFMPSGAPSIAFLKSWAALGLREAGIRLLGTGETDDQELPAIGDAALDVVSTYYYTACLDTPRNKAWTAAFRKKYGDAVIPSFAAVTAYDGMHLVYEVVRKHGARFTGDQAMAVMRGARIDSPRGPLIIDAEERDTIQTVYIRKVARVDGKLCNAVIDSYPDQKDLWKVLNK